MNTELNNQSLNKIRSHQDFSYALLGGSLAALLSAVLWAVITVSTERQIGFMAIGVGFIVGYAVQFFGAGIDSKFGYLGAALSLLGCIIGNLFSQIGFIAHEQSLNYLEVVSLLDLAITIDIITESFQPMDLLFYGFAIYEGYRFAFRKVSDEEVRKAESDDHYDVLPPYSKLRMPLAMSSLAILSVVFFMLNRDVGGVKTYNYESGKKMSEGELINGKEEGAWTYWYENGKIRSKGYYTGGQADSLWKWFDESGKLIKTGSYKKGLENGLWLAYYKNGMLSDSGSYHESRMTSLWKFWYENGNLTRIGSYKRNAQDGLWKTYYENGQLSTEGKMDNGIPTGQWNTFYLNGQLQNQVTYSSDNKILIDNLWDPNGKQLILHGNGYYKSFADNGTLILEGNVVEGNKKGEWKTYYTNGKLSEEGVYENELYLVANNWDIDSSQKVFNGNGVYVSYYDDGKTMYETGEIIKGLREGLWKSFYQPSGGIFQEQIYKNNKPNGLQKVYYESGKLYTSSEMVNGIKEGECTWYNESGTISSTAIFHNDKKDGIQKIWSESGALIKEEVYKNGELVEEKDM